MKTKYRQMITLFGLGVAFCLSSVPSWSDEKGPKKGIKEVVEAIRVDGEKQTEEQKVVRTIYDEGFTLLGEDDTLKIGAWMQNDVRGIFKGHPGRTQFLVRRARLDFKGALEKIFGFRVMGEFEGDGGTQAANLKEGWLEYNQFPSFRIKVGQFKEPYGLENLYGDLWLDFLERPMANNFIRPEQDLGLMFFGKLFKKRVEYGVGVFNGSGTNVAEGNDDKDVAFRASAVPVKNHLTIGGSVTYGKQTATLTGVGPTTPGGTRIFAFVSPAGGNTVMINDYRTRLGGDAEWFSGPASAKAEYVYSRMKNIRFGAVVRNLDIHGVSAQGSYVLTGEKKSNQSSVTPDKPFDPKKRQWGAFELAGRAEVMRSDGGVINAGLSAGTDDLWSVTGASNWYLNRHVRLSGNYVYTRFDDVIAAAGGKNSEHLVLFRFQFNL